MQKKSKKIKSLDKYIEESLYSKKRGYYMQNNPFGIDGDFVTAPNISILFSEMIAIWCISFWEKNGFPKKINIIELGSGNGEMMNRIIITLKNFPEIFSKCNFLIYEKSPYLIKIQKRKLANFKIKWIKSLKKVDKNFNIYLANEFFDAIPVKQFIKIKGYWFERYVDETNYKKTYLNIPINISKIKKIFPVKFLKNQTFLEYSPQSNVILKQIAGNLKKSTGGLLIIDYGYSGFKMKDTVQSLYKHKKNHVLDNKFKSDITYTLNFSLIKIILSRLGLKVNTLIEQGIFLKNLGILHRAEIISQRLSFSKKAEIFYRIDRLINKKKMGKLFKVLQVCSKKNKF